MNCIQNSPTNNLSHKVIVSFTSALATIGIALAIIGLTASLNGPFNVIVGFGSLPNRILLGASLIVLTLNLLQIVALCKQKKALSISQLETPQEIIPTFSDINGLNSPKEDSLSESIPTAAASIPQTYAIQTSVDQSILSKPSSPVTVQVFTPTQSGSTSSSMINPVCLPNDIWTGVFSYLDIDTLENCCLVCKQWHVLASDKKLWNAIDLRKLSPLLTVFDETDWKAHVDVSSWRLSFEIPPGIPPPDRRKEIQILKRILSNLKKYPIEKNAGITLLTMPGGFTFEKLVKLVDFLEEKGGKIHFIKPILNFDDIQIDYSYKIVITNSCIKTTKNKLASLKEKKLKKMGCQLPKPVELATFFVTTHLSIQKFFCESPNYSSLCAKQNSPYYLSIKIFPNSIYLYEENLFSGYHSVANGVWKI